jgi:hypothetical protein
MHIMKFRFRSTYRCHGGSSKKRGLKKRGLKKRGLKKRGLKKRGLKKRGLKKRGLKKRGLKKRGLKKRGLRLKKGGLDKDHTLSIRPCTEKSHGRGAEICRRT